MKMHSVKSVACCANKTILQLECDYREIEMSIATFAAGARRWERTRRIMHTQLQCNLHSLPWDMSAAARVKDRIEKHICCMQEACHANVLGSQVIYIYTKAEGTVSKPTTNGLTMTLNGSDDFSNRWRRF